MQCGMYYWVDTGPYCNRIQLYYVKALKLGVQPNIKWGGMTSIVLVDVMWEEVDFAEKM